MTMEEIGGGTRGSGVPSFTEEVRRRTKTRFPDAELDATAVGISLARAAQAHAVLSENVVHRQDQRTWLSFRVLYVVWVFAPVSARDVVRNLQLSRQTVSNTLRALESDGLISRTRNNADARVITLELTDKGRDSIEAALQRQFRLDDQCFGGLTAQERQQLVTLLDKARSGIARVDAGGAGLDDE